MKQFLTSGALILPCLSSCFKVDLIMASILVFAASYMTTSNSALISRFRIAGCCVLQDGWREMSCFRRPNGTENGKTAFAMIATQVPSQKSIFHLWDLGLCSSHTALQTAGFNERFLLQHEQEETKRFSCRWCKIRCEESRGRG